MPARTYYIELSDDEQDYLISLIKLLCFTLLIRWH